MERWYKGRSYEIGDGEYGCLQRLVLLDLEGKHIGNASRIRSLTMFHLPQVLPSQRGIVEAPFWSYQLGLQGGWMPKDPRSAIGTCGASAGPVFSGQFDSWMTGGAGAGELKSTIAWPPASINLAPAAANALPTYTTTGVVTTLPAPTYTNTAGQPIVSGNGWFNANDNRLAPAPISGCPYPNPWDARNVAIPDGCGVPAAGPLTSTTTSTGTTTRTTTTTSTTSTTRATTTTTSTTTTTAPDRR